MGEVQAQAPMKSPALAGLGASLTSTCPRGHQLSYLPFRSLSFFSQFPFSSRFLELYRTSSIFGFPCTYVRPICINVLVLRESLSRLGLHNDALGLRESSSRLGLHNNALVLRESSS